MLGSLVQETWTGAHPARGHEDGEGVRVSVIQAEAKRAECLPWSTEGSREVLSMCINACRERLEKKGQTLLSERMSTNWNKANHIKTWEKHFFLRKFIKHWNRWYWDFAKSQYLGISKPQADMALSNLLLSHLQYELDLAIPKRVLQPHLFCDSLSDFHFMLLIMLFSCTKCSVSLVWSQVKWLEVCHLTEDKQQPWAADLSRWFSQRSLSGLDRDFLPLVFHPLV